ncbi:MAG: hypothetical protein NXY57DRAFT_966195 [Lentinula lateritia]|nr:MAG: hypothetical protein NXY57DRAFT_966195 [Lentinula lateritia]
MSLRCRLCWANIDDLSVPERQRHYGAHLEGSEGNPQANSPRWTTSKNLSLWLIKGKLRNSMTATVEESQDIFWYPAMQTPPPKNFIPGIHTGFEGSPSPIPCERDDDTRNKYCDTHLGTTYHTHYEEDKITEHMDKGKRFTLPDPVQIGSETDYGLEK